MTKYPFADLGPFQSEIHRLRWLVRRSKRGLLLGFIPSRPTVAKILIISPRRLLGMLFTLRAVR